MANWEKLIEEHYNKKKEVDISLIMEMIDLELENTFQSGAIEGHAGKRLSTKGKKKAGGDPFDEEPPKERSKSAPAGFGALEEGELEEATIRTGRTYYYVSPSKMPKSLLRTIIEKYPEITSPNDLADRLYTQASFEDDNAVFTIFLADKVTKRDVLDANKKGDKVASMQDSVEITKLVKKIEIDKTKITWLLTKPEELRAENEHLGKIKEKFAQAGINEENPVTIIVKGRKIENVASIDKISDKQAVGDFALFSPEGDSLFTMSHKAPGFERYAALVTTLKALSAEDKTYADSFIRQVETLWKNGVISGERSSKGYFQKITSPSAASQVVYLIYGKGTRRAESLFVGEISLKPSGENTFEMGVEPSSGKSGAAVVHMYPDVPSEEEYLPIFRTRFGSGGSKVGFNEDEVEMVNRAIADPSNPLTIDTLKTLKINFSVEEVPGTDSVIVDNLSVPVRFYISPMRRNDGAVELEPEK